MITDVERNILGHLLESPELMADYSGAIRPKHFTTSAHKTIYLELENLNSKGVEYDPILVVSNLETKGLLGQAGGTEYIYRIVMDRQSLASFETHVSQLTLNYKQRLLGKISSEIANAVSSNAEYQEKVQRIDELLTKSNIESNDSGPVFVDEALPDYYNVLERRIDGVENGLKTGFDGMDRHLGGLRDSDLIILAARPSMGKTTLALNITENIAANNRVLFFSLEMDKTQIIDKIISSVGTVHLNDIRNGLGDGTVPKAVKAIQQVRSNLLIDDTAGLQMSAIRTRARRTARKHDVKLIVVDYLQLINDKAESETVKIGNISRSLKEMAKELKVPVIALSQLNRGLENREDKIPKMADLRQSGQIEQDADIILMLYRDWVYNKDSDEKQAGLFVRKYRNGQLGQIDLEFQGCFSRFRDHQGDPIDYTPKKQESQTFETKNKKYYSKTIGAKQ